MRAMMAPGAADDRDDHEAHHRLPVAEEPAGELAERPRHPPGAGRRGLDGQRGGGGHARG